MLSLVAREKLCEGRTDIRLADATPQIGGSGLRPIFGSGSDPRIYTNSDLIPTFQKNTSPDLNTVLQEKPDPDYK